MAPLPYNNTDIYVLTYFNGFRNHQISVRFDAVQQTVQDVADNVGQFFQAAEPALPDNSAYVSARVLSQGLSFTLPAPVPSIALSGDVTSPDPRYQALQITVPGRSQQGRRNTVALFGLHINPPISWVGTGSSNVTLGNILAFLQGTLPAQPLPGSWLSIDGTETIWYNRATFDYNDYWVRQLRS
jgi:hypothetical protein